MLTRRGCYALIFVVVVSALLVVGGCGLGGGGSEDQSTTSTSTLGATTGTDSAANTTTTLTPADELSTFKAKDPFIQQAQPTTTTAGATTTTSGSSTSSSSTSSTQKSSDTASVHVHSLKVLAIETGPTVTFRVDGTVYDEKRVGDVVTTGWGQVQVLSIDAAGQYVKLLHGSETLTLEVGQTTFE